MRSSRISRWLLLAVALTVLTGTIAPSFARDSSDDPGVLRISSQDSGYVRIYLPGAVTLDRNEDLGAEHGPNGDVQFSGGQELVAVAIVPDPPTRAALEESYFVAGQFHDCLERVCASGKSLDNFIFTSDGPGWNGSGKRTVILSAGAYRVYLIGEGELEVRLRIGNGEVQEEVRATKDVDYSFRTGVATTASNDFYVGWEQGHRFSKSGFILNAYWARIDAYSGIVDGECSYKNEAPFPAGSSLGPHCQAYPIVSDEAPRQVGLPPAGFSSVGFSNAGTDTIGTSQVVSSRSLRLLRSPWTRWTYGQWISSPTPISDSSSLSMFLSW